MPQAQRDVPKARREPIFVTLSLRVECSLKGSHSILALSHKYRLSLLSSAPPPHKSILVHYAQKKNINFIVFAEMMQMEQKTVDFFSIKVYLRIKIWIQNQISKIINQKHKSKTSSKEIGIFICWIWRLERV